MAVLALAAFAALGAASPAALETTATSKTLRDLRHDLGQLLMGRAAVREAASLLGTPYRWGGDDPKEGFDCSGYTRFVFARLGQELPRSALGQYSGGVMIEKPAAMPGDLVFFATSGSPSGLHVGIYAGDGAFLHAPSSGKNIQRDRLDQGYGKKRFHAVRRWRPLGEGGRPGLPDRLGAGRTNKETAQ